MTLIIDRFDGIIKTNYWGYHNKNCVGTAVNITPSPTWKCTYGLTIHDDGCGLEAIVKCSDYYSCRIDLFYSDGSAMAYAQAWCEDHDPRRFNVNE